MPADAAPSYVIVPGLAAAGARIELPADESHYLARVCRARAGDRVTATDGAGQVATLRLIEVGARVRADVETCERLAAARDGWVLCGAPEGERADWMVEKLAELGVRVLQPVDCRRASWQRAASRLERWRRVARAALRQSRRAFALEIRPPVALDQALAAVPAGSGLWVCSPDGAPAGDQDPAAARITVGLVGPAEGLDEDEQIRTEARGFLPIRLADGRLRVETAALAWAAWWASAGAAGPVPRVPESGAGQGLDASRDRP